MYFIGFAKRVQGVEDSRVQGNKLKKPSPGALSPFFAMLYALCVFFQGSEFLEKL
jgi:hypothetical protein